MKRKFIYLLLWALGFGSACSDKKNEDMPVMYAPLRPDTILLTLSGRVTDHAGTPIPRIVVGTTFSGQQVLTDENGEYVLLSDFPGSTQFGMTFTDIDGAANGGEFAAKSLDVELSTDDVTTDDDGRLHFTRTDIDVVLEEKMQ